MSCFERENGIGSELFFVQPDETERHKQRARLGHAKEKAWGKAKIKKKRREKKKRRIS